MNKTHYERRSHEQGNYEITPTYTDQVVVTIKSLATGQTMQVYLDEPTQKVENGINYTDYTGHFYEKKFLITSEGFEVTGLPLMYPYWNGPDQIINTTTMVIDTENHYFSEKNPNIITSVNLANFPITIELADFQSSDVSSGNVVLYNFTRFSGISEEPIVVPANPGAEVID